MTTQEWAKLMTEWSGQATWLNQDNRLECDWGVWSRKQIMEAKAWKAAQ